MSEAWESGKVYITERIEDQFKQRESSGEGNFVLCEGRPELSIRPGFLGAQLLPGVAGLCIRTVTGMEIIRHGQVRYHADLGIYYCGGGSWPEEIVTGCLRERM